MEIPRREEIARAVTDHARWIVSLSECLDGLADGSPSRCRRFVETVGAVDACALGRWLDGMPTDLESTHLRSVRGLHARFHRAASEVIARALAGDADGAARLLEERLCPLSKQLVGALETWVE